MYDFKPIINELELQKGLQRKKLYISFHRGEQPKSYEIIEYKKHKTCDEITTYYDKQTCQRKKKKEYKSYYTISFKYGLDIKIGIYLNGNIDCLYLNTFYVSIFNKIRKDKNFVEKKFQEWYDNAKQNNNPTIVNLNAKSLNEAIYNLDESFIKSLASALLIELKENDMP